MLNREQEVYVLTIHLIECPDRFPELCLDLLVPEERQKASSFIQREKGQRWAYYRATLRQILARELGCDPAAIPLEYGPHGKPFLQGCAFNLTHAGDLALLAISEFEPIGIDVEEKSRAHRMLRIEHKIAHPEEVPFLPEEPDKRANVLLDLWNAKEAVLKAIGTGLTILPARVKLNAAIDRVDFIDGRADFPDMHLQRVKLTDSPGHQAFIASGSSAEPHFQRWTASTAC